MKTLFTFFAICGISLFTGGCIKTQKLVYTKPLPAAHLLAATRVWHEYEHYAHYPPTDTMFNLPDTSFALTVINDSTVRFPGNDVWSTFDLHYIIARSVNGLQEFDGSSGQEYTATIWFNPTQDTVRIWQRDGTDYTNLREYYYHTH